MRKSTNIKKIPLSERNTRNLDKSKKNINIINNNHNILKNRNKNQIYNNDNLKI